MIVAENVNNVGQSVSVAGASPTPESCTVCVPTPSTIVNVPVAGPAVAGSNFTAIWQLELAASDIVPHALLASTKGPETESLVIGTGTSPLFSAVTWNAADVAPASTLPKLIVAGNRVTSPGAMPVPLRGTTSCPPATLALTVSWPVRFPTWLGTNVTWTAQLAPAWITAFAQLSVSIKSLLASTSVGDSAIPPVFVSVTVSALLADPFICG